MEIYIDVLFLLNFIMDFLIVWIVNMIARNQASTKRLILGAAVGAALLCVLLFIPKMLFNVIGYFGISIILILVSFKVRTFKEFVKLFLLTYLVAVCMGGTCIAIFYYTKLGSILGNLFIYGLNHFSVKLLFIAVVISFIMMKLFMNWYGKFMLNKKRFYQLMIHINERAIETKGLVDTGNSLEDPFTHLPVIIVESTQLKDIIPEKLLDLIVKNNIQDLNLLATVSENTELRSRIRVIPFSSIGKENGLLVGFRPDYIALQDIKVNRKVEDVIVAIANKTLAKDGSYHALIHPALIE